MRYRKTFALALCMTISCYARIIAQTNPVENYLKQVGDCAEIYNGKMETNYNSLLYENLPYYKNADFTDASITYRDNYYPGQRVRLDLFKEQLILLPPEKQFGTILSSQNVEKVFMYNKTFVWLVPPKESGLKTGFYIQLLDGAKIRLLCKESFYLQSKLTTYYFIQNVRYYFLYNDRYYPAKNKGSFTKLFPQYKKQINQFSKTHSLNFKQNADESLVSLAGYCEELLISTGKQ